jgi:hypothetical protein
LASWPGHRSRLGFLELSTALVNEV